MVERWEIITEGSGAQGRVGRARRERRGWPARRSATPSAPSLQRYSRPKRRLLKSRRAVGKDRRDRPGHDPCGAGAGDPDLENCDDVLRPAWAWPPSPLARSRRIYNRWATHLPRRPRHAPGTVPASAPCSRRGFFARGADLQLIQETLATRRSTRPRCTRVSRRRARMVTVARLLGRRRAMIPAAVPCGECPSLAAVGLPIATDDGSENGTDLAPLVWHGYSDGPDPGGHGPGPTALCRLRRHVVWAGARPALCRL